MQVTRKLPACKAGNLIEQPRSDSGAGNLTAHAHAARAYTQHVPDSARKFTGFYLAAAGAAAAAKYVASASDTL